MSKSLNPHDFMIEVVSEFRRKFTPDEIGAIYTKLRVLINIAKDEEHAESYKLHSRLASAWQQVDNDPELALYIIRDISQSKECGVYEEAENLIYNKDSDLRDHVKDVKSMLERIAMHYWLGLKG